MEKWHRRLHELVGTMDSPLSDDSSSQWLRDAAFWHRDEPLDEGEIVGWLFIHEEKGMRMK